MSGHVEDTGQSLHKIAQPVGAHMLLLLLYFTQNNR